MSVQRNKGCPFDTHAPYKGMWNECSFFSDEGKEVCGLRIHMLIVNDLTSARHRQSVKILPGDSKSNRLVTC